MKTKIFLFLFLFLCFFLIGLLLLNKDSSNNYSKFIKDNTPPIIKNFLKKTIFYIPYSKREIKNLNSTIEKLNSDNNNLTLENYKLNNILNYGKHKYENYKSESYNFNSVVLPFFDNEDLHGNKKSGYVETYKDKIIVVFTSGKIVYLNKNSFVKNNVLEFKNVENNLKSNFFDQKIKWSGVKDIKVIYDNLYVSLTKEIKKNCYNTSLYKSKINETNLNFVKIFEPIECFSLDRSIQAFKYFNGYQNGGRITYYKDKIYLTTGDYNYWEKPQDVNSYAGKIISIDKNNYETKIISLGHRNPQGLQIIENKNSLISTEHGPKGGDEINLIKLNEKKIPNYGWPMSSYGEHYDVVPINSFTKKFAPLYKSHKDHSFVEPIKYFDKAIGISEIIRDYKDQSNNSFYLTSLKKNTLYKIIFDEEFNFLKIYDEILLSERLRDIIYDDENSCYYIYAETTPKLISMCNK